jgi:hypothetical protein
MSPHRPGAGDGEGLAFDGEQADSETLTINSPA